MTHPTSPNIQKLDIYHILSDFISQTECARTPQVNVPYAAVSSKTVLKTYQTIAIQTDSSNENKYPNKEKKKMTSLINY